MCRNNHRRCVEIVLLWLCPQTLWRSITDPWWSWKSKSWIQGTLKSPCGYLPVTNEDFRSSAGCLMFAAKSVFLHAPRPFPCANFSPSRLQAPDHCPQYSERFDKKRYFVYKWLLFYWSHWKQTMLGLKNNLSKITFPVLQITTCNLHLPSEITI